MKNNEMLELATRYASEGLKVFPLSYNEKIPVKKELFGSWRHNATNNEQQIIEWYDHNNNNNTNYNIAIVCGSQLNKKYLLIIDIDSYDHKKKRGMEFYDKYMKKYGALPETFTVRSATGGLHLYYYARNEKDIKLISEGFDNFNSALGIDIRGEGAYIVGAPSMVNGKRYEIATDRDIAFLDDAVIDFIIKSLLQTYTMYNGDCGSVLNRVKKLGYDVGGIESGTEPTNGSKSAFESDIIRSIDQIDPDTDATGKRDTIIFNYLCSRRGYGGGDMEIETLAKAMNERLQKPLPESQLNGIIKQVITKYPVGNGKGTAEIDPSTITDFKGITLDQIEEKPIDWLIPDFIPKGGLTFICGDGGVGKTFILCDLISALSTGEMAFFEDKNKHDFHKRKEGTVLFFSAEDDFSKVLKKRLKSCDANEKNIVTILPSDARFTALKYNSSFLISMVREYNPIAVVFDPLQSFIPDNVNMVSRNQMRNLMQPLIGLCEETNTAIIIANHTNKRSGAYGRKRMSDSTDIWDIARSVFIVGDTGENDIKYFSHEKSNYGKMQKTQLFTIYDGRVNWHGDTVYKDKDYVAKSDSESKGKQGRDDASKTILRVLSDNDNCMKKSDLQQYCSDLYSIASATFDRAIRDLKDKKAIDVKYSGEKDKKGKIAIVKKLFN